MRRTLGGGLSSNQFVTNGILARLNVSLFSHYSSEKKVPGALEVLGRGRGSPGSQKSRICGCFAGACDT
jgi:hypothetical protein